MKAFLIVMTHLMELEQRYATREGTILEVKVPDICLNLHIGITEAKPKTHNRA